MKSPTRRKVLGGIGGFIGAGTVGASSALAQEGDDAPGQRAPLRVMSYNIHNGIGTDGVYDLRRIADVIAAVDPDVVALQEVHDQNRAYWEDDSPTNYDAQHELLADWLGMNHVVFTANRDWQKAEDDASWTEKEKEAGYRRRAGSVILSKHPILESTVYSYETQTQWDPPYQDVPDRKLTETRINVEGSHIRFYNTHLHAGLGEVNAAQVNELVDIVGRHDGPQILAGDFNILDGRDNYQVITNVYTDLLREVGADNPTAPTPPISWGPLRLDYFFASDSVAIESGERITYGTEYSPSDHFPIVADVTLPRGNRGRNP